MNDIVKVDSKVIDDYLFSTGTKLTEQQKTLFKQLAILHNLNPFKREIYAIQYGNEMKIVTGYEVYLKRAEETKDLNGWEFRIENDGTDCKGILTIYRKSWDKPFVHEVYLSEYDSGKSLWVSKPKTMLKKVAVAQGFRMAFPLDFDGMLYTADELGSSSTHEEEKQAIDSNPEEKQVVKRWRGFTTISESQAKMVYALLKALGIAENRADILQFYFGVKNETDISPEKFQNFIDKIEVSVNRKLGKQKLTENELVLVTDMILKDVASIKEGEK